jgi:hypothetical protein
VHPFWDQVIRPLLDAARPQTVVEVGAERGLTTMRLLGWAHSADAVVHSIDPAPRFDVARAELEHPGRLHFHRETSLIALRAIGAVDAALIDGDHNWHTVNSELATLAETAAAAEQPLPLILAHDAGWPYGRRDMYYEPSAIPIERRHDAARAGIAPGRSELGSPGVNAGLWNATHEGGPRNGVLTAIEDFIAAGREPYELVVIDGWHGLAVLASRARLGASPALAAEIERLRSSEFLRSWLSSIELARIAAEVRTGAAREAEARATRRASGLEQRLLDEPEPEPDGDSTLGGR